MTRDEMYQLMNASPVFHLATMDAGWPRVRGMLLYRADENGILFHTGAAKDLYAQIRENPRAELCFSANGTQLRVSGSLEIVNDDALKTEIIHSPGRKFLKDWVESKEFRGMEDLIVLRLAKGTAVTWTMQKNFAPKEPLQL